MLREVEGGEGSLVGQLAWPLRSRKKTADAIVGGDGGGGGLEAEKGEVDQRLKRIWRQIIAHEIRQRGIS